MNLLFPSRGVFGYISGSPAFWRTTFDKKFLENHRVNLQLRVENQLENQRSGIDF